MLPKANYENSCMVCRRCIAAFHHRADKRRIVPFGRLYGLLCEKEKNGEWEKFLNTIIIELMGLEDSDSINYWALMGKLHSLRFLSYEYFRKTVFECINLVRGLVILDGYES